MYANKTIIQIGANIGDFPECPIFNNIGKFSEGETTKVILVEPVPHLFMQLQFNYMKSYGVHPNIIYINKAVSNFVGEMELLIASERNDFSNLPYWASGLASVNPTHAITHIPSLLVDKIIVKTTTINEIIKDHNLTVIDLLQTDTEGHDYEILMHYDFCIKPSKLIFEHMHIDGTFNKGKKYYELMHKLYQLGYHVISTNHNDIIMELCSYA